MLECLLGLIVVTIIAIIALWAFDSVVKAVGANPPPAIFVLVRVLVAILVLLWALNCLGGFDVVIAPGRHHLLR